MQGRMDLGLPGHGAAGEGMKWENWKFRNLGFP